MSNLYRAGIRAGMTAVASAALIAMAGCGGDDEAASAARPPASTQSETQRGLMPVREGTVTLQPVLFPTSTSRDEIHLAPIAPAHGNERHVVLPVADGKIAPRSGRQATIRLDGGFRISGGEHAVEVKDLLVHAATGDVFAVLDGDEARVLRLDRSDLHPVRDGSAVRLQRVQLRLAPALSAALNDAFNVDTFPAGMPFGMLDARLVTSGGA